MELNKNDEIDNSKERHDEDSQNFLKKASVAVTGGALIAAGIPLIPLPGPGDFMVVGGLALLATEFPQAQRIIDVSTDHLEKFVEGDEKSEGINNKEGEEEEEDNGMKEKNQRLNHEASKQQHFPPQMEEIDQALDRGMEHVRNLTKQTILPFMKHVSSNKTKSEEKKLTMKEP